MSTMPSNADNTYKVTVGNTKGVSSSQAAYVQYGYGQVEPNHLSARRTGRIFAQLPADKDIEILENGQFVKYDYAGGACNFTGIGEWMLVFNEVKVYEDRSSDADYAMKKTDFVSRIYNATGAEMPDGTVMVPRVFGTLPGDIMTTNCVDATDLALGDILTPDPRSGLLVLVGGAASSAAGAAAKTTPTAKAGEVGKGNTVIDAAATEMQWQVSKVYTMPDNQRGVKLVRVM